MCCHSTHWWGILHLSSPQLIKVNPQKSAGYLRMWFIWRDRNKKANIKNMKTSLLRSDPRFLVHFTPFPYFSKLTGTGEVTLYSGLGRIDASAVSHAVCPASAHHEYGFVFPSEMCFTGTWLFFKLVSLKPASYLVRSGFVSPFVWLFQEWRVAFSSSVFFFYLSDICCKLICLY